MKNSTLRQDQGESGLAPLAIILILAGALVLGGAGFWYLNQNKVEAPAQN